MPFTQNHTKSVIDWLPVLNWPVLPNFGHCHTHTDPKKFIADYFVSDELASLYRNMCATMDQGANSANMRITGDPGAGKTSYLYALKRMSQDGDPILRRFHFYIFHINRVDDGDTFEQYSSEIIFNIKNAWKSLFEASNKIDIYTRFKQQKLSTKDLINKLSGYYIKHKEEFNKILVFVIDDVDLLPGDHVAIVADCILRNIEVASVKKWLVLRDITYDNYKGSTKQRIEQFFPDPYSFPSVSLYLLFLHRIKAIIEESQNTSMILKNPFSEELCDLSVKTICEGNMREGLSLLKSLLEDSPPKGIDSSASEEFIQNYLDRSSINTFLNSHKLIDLHADIFRVGIYPLAVDILACAVHHSSGSIIYGSVNDCIVKRDISSSKIIGGENATVRVRKPDFDYVVERLEGHGLLNTSKREDTIRLTEKGKILSSYAIKEHYYNFCRSKDKTDGAGKEYWILASRVIKHKDIVSTFLRWKNREMGSGL